MKFYTLNALRILIVSSFFLSYSFAVKLKLPASQRLLYHHKVSEKSQKRSFDRSRPLNNATPRGIALKGYDPVSYFYGTPQKGSKDIKFKDGQTGITYFFIAKEHKKEFLRNPNKYIPQVGSWCAYSMLGGNKRSVDPKVFKIIDGRIYFFASKRFRRKWDKQINKGHPESDFIEQMEDHWGKTVSLYIKSESNFPYIYENPHS